MFSRSDEVFAVIHEKEPSANPRPVGRSSAAPNGPVPQLAEGNGPNPSQYRFESDGGYQHESKGFYKESSWTKPSKTSSTG